MHQREVEPVINLNAHQNSKIFLPSGAIAPGWRAGNLPLHVNECTGRSRSIQAALLKHISAGQSTRSTQSLL